MNQSGDDPGDSRTAAATKKSSQSRKGDAQPASESGKVTANQLSPVQDFKRRKIETQSPSGNVSDAGSGVATSHHPDTFFTDLSVDPDLGLVNIVPPKNTDTNNNLENVDSRTVVQPNLRSRQNPVMISSDSIEQDDDDRKSELKLNGRGDAGSNHDSFNVIMLEDDHTVKELKASDNRKSNLQDHDLISSTEPRKQLRLLADLTEDELELQAMFCFKTELTEVVTCLYCYMEGHMREDCPDRICDHCKTDDHLTKDCREVEQASKSPYCTDCRGEGHEINDCPFSYRWWLGDYKEMIPKFVNCAVSTQCYKCASHQHLGDDCPMARKSQKSIWSAEFVNHFLDESLPEAQLDDAAPQMGITNEHTDQNGSAFVPRDIRPLPRRRRMGHNSLNSGTIPPPPTVSPPPPPRDPLPPRRRDSPLPPPPDRYRPSYTSTHQPLRDSGTSGSTRVRNQPVNQASRRQAPPPPRLGSHVVERSNPSTTRELRSRSRRAEGDHYRPSRR